MNRESYRSELAALRADVEAMGDRVSQQVEDALTVYETGDDALASRIRDHDEAINDTYLALESRCVDLIALQQPVAGDLRLIVASFKILTDLERIGDLATNLARYGRVGTSGAPFGVDVVALGRDARAMVEDGLDAYVDRDPEDCRQLAVRDDELDEACRQASASVVRGLIDFRGDAGLPIERRLESVSRLLLTIRDVERIGDHAENVAARTLYAIEGDEAMLA